MAVEAVGRHRFPLHARFFGRKGAAVWTFAAYIEFDPDTRRYAGIVPGIPGAHTQGETLDELHQNLKEALELCLEECKGAEDELPRFVG